MSSSFSCAYQRFKLFIILCCLYSYILPIFKSSSFGKIYILPESLVYVLNASTLSDICFVYFSDSLQVVNSLSQYHLLIIRHLKFQIYYFFMVIARACQRNFCVIPSHEIFSYIFFWKFYSSVFCTQIQDPAHINFMMILGMDYCVDMQLLLSPLDQFGICIANQMHLYMYLYFWALDSK